MKKPFLLIFLLPLLLFNCVNGELRFKTLDFEEFSLRGPVDWKSFSSQGYDSKVGGITNGKEELVFDYGWYSYDFKNETTATHRRIHTTIDSKTALIVLPINTGEGIVGLFINVDDKTKFNLWGRDIKNEDVVKKIFESVKFNKINKPVMVNPQQSLQ
jgi:hypothetical protein